MCFKDMRPRMKNWTKVQAFLDLGEQKILNMEQMGDPSASRHLEPFGPFPSTVVLIFSERQSNAKLAKLSPLCLFLAPSLKSNL